jgi:hypothetical protein
MSHRKCTLRHKGRPYTCRELWPDYQVGTNVDPEQAAWCDACLQSAMREFRKLAKQLGMAVIPGR